ncbi:MAG: HEAT repeat domain-containing protein [Verrucomicrobiaceae bacterium]|nr:HEAT repeat domain-containing protein [Verrucomicrobiaceae bacterium]
MKSLAFLLLPVSALAATFPFEGQHLTVPDGFSIERIAATQLAPRPISGAFDDRGRFYVTDSAGMSDGAEKQLEARAHRLLRLVDRDGDGKFDEQTVFADKLMFPEGCLFYAGSVYVAAPPQIWKFTDADDDGVAEKREVWFDGRTLTHCGNDLHGPYLGRDGWFYWTKGAYAEQHYTLPDGRPLDTHAAHIFRARPDATGLEPVLTGGMANPVGVAFTADGSRFLSGTFFTTPADGERDGLIHSIYGGVYGQERESLREHALTGDVMPMLAGSGASAPCGMICAESDALGLRGSLLTCYFNLHKVMRHQLTPAGATFRTQDSDLVASDSPDFHPTDVIEDADGSLIVLDTGGWYKICCPTSQLAKPDVLGGIYRVRRGNMATLEDARGEKITWEKAGLSPLLDDPRHLVRRRAAAELARRGEVSTHVTSTPARQNRLWALSRVNSAAARQAAREALNDGDAGVVAVALQSIALWRDGAAREPLQELLASPDPSLARGAAEALGRCGDRRSVPALLAAAARVNADKLAASGCPSEAPARTLEHSIIYALIEIADAAAVRAGLSAPDSRTHRAALVALDQMPHGDLRADEVTPLLDDRDDRLRLTAAWIVTDRPEWGDALAGHFRSRLKQAGADAALVSQLAQLAKSPAIEVLLAEAARTGNTSALRAIAAAAPRQAPAAWLAALSELLANADAAPPAEAIAAAKALPWPKEGHAPLLRALATAGNNTALPAQLRLDALAAARSVPHVDAALFEFLSASVLPDRPVQQRTAAASVLATARLDAAQQLALAGTLQKTGPLELPRLLPAFERGPDATLGRRLVASLHHAVGFAGLRADLLAALLKKYPAEIQTAAQPLITRLNADVEKQAARLDSLLTELPTGDLRRGQAAFQRLGCIGCHRIGYAGGTIGPDVTRLGSVRTPRDLVEAIVFPSASIVRGYETWSVQTSTGEVFTGTLAKDERDEVVLNIAPQVKQRLARSQIAQMNPVPVSLMPQGFGELLKTQDLADLLAFLQATQKK